MSKRTVARYTVTTGLAGCYMPDYNSGPMEFSSRRELANCIRSEIERMEFPQRMFNEVKLRRLWGCIQHAGSSSSYHFRLQHGQEEIAFHGLTEEEYNEQRDAED